MGIILFSINHMLLRKAYK